MTPSRQYKSREVTGRTVLFWLIGFFGFVFIVNAIMVRAATSTFGGVKTQSSYRAGQMFEGEVARATRQQALGWQVDGSLAGRGGKAVLDVRVRDARGGPVTGLTASARLAHPADERLDHVIALGRIGAGQFRGEAGAHPGQWELIVSFYRGKERVFRSRSRVTLK
jgi:nitrogen fixation protein FixH